MSVTAPNYLHREIGVAVARAGKHLWIEKPVGVVADDARAVSDAVAVAGVASAVGFNYRNAPAVATARELIAAGELGTVTHARFRMFSDYAAHPQGALSWRFERGRGGSGVLGDLASHAVDLARYLLGEIESLVADTGVVIARRPRPAKLASRPPVTLDSPAKLASRPPVTLDSPAPLAGPAGAGSHFALAAGGEPGDVENEDTLTCLLRFAGGARATLDASRVAVGAQNDYGFEVRGTRGMLAWDFRRMGELSVGAGDGYQNESVRTIFVGPGDGEFGAFQPGAGIAMSYDDLKVVEAAAFLRSIAEGKPHGATVADAVRAAVALDAMAESVRSGSWVGVRA